MNYSVQPLFNIWVLSGGIACALIVTFLFLREKAQLSRKQRFVLASLRISILVLIALAFIRPGFSYSKKTTPEQSIAVMIDQSLSMRLPSGIGTKTRWQIAKRLAQEIASSSSGLPTGTSFRLFAFDSSLKSDSGVLLNPSGTDSFENALSKLQESPSGAITDLGKPLKDVVDQTTDPPLQSIIWLSDGIQTAEDIEVNVRQVVRQLAESNIPLYLVGIGPRSGSNESLDQWVDTVPEQIDAFAKNVVNVRGLVKTVGLANRDLTVNATLKDDKGNVVSQASQAIVPNRNNQTMPVSFQIVAPSKGAYEIVVEALAVDGEATLLNNHQTCFLNVRESGSRVLYIEGEPRLEQRFLKLSLADSPDLKMDYFPIYRNTKSQWPVTMVAQLLEDDTYDCIILGDVDSSAFSEESMQAIVNRVAKGAGLILLGGYHAYGPGGYERTPLAQLLPINIQGTSRQMFDQPVNKVDHLPGPVSMRLTRRHPIFELGENGELSNEELVQRWKSIPAFLGANKFGEVLPQPGVQLLATASDSDKKPLIVASSYDRGRVLALAFDSSYLWYRNGQSDIHRRFWRQAVLWAMQSLDRTPGLKVSMDKRRVRTGSDSDYRVEWTGVQPGDPIPSNVKITVERAGGDQPRVLTSNQRDRSSVAGNVKALLQAGRFELVATAIGSDGVEYQDRLPFDVVDDAIELINGSPDWQLMNQLAELNERAGGKVIPVDQVDSLMELLRQNAQTASVELVEAYHLGEGAVDSWILLAMFALLMTIQWSLRKKWSLA